MPNYFPHTLRIYDTTVSGSGDETTTLVATVPADVEDFLGLSQTNYSDETIGTLAASIPSTNAYYLANKQSMQGKLAEYENNWWRITEVRPAISAYTNKVDFIDLVLEKAEAPDASSL